MADEIKKPEETNLEEKKLDVQPETKSSIRDIFGLKPKEPEKKPEEKKPEEKPEVKPEEKEPETKEPEKKPEDEFIPIKHLGKEVKIPVAERDKYLQMGYDYQHVKDEASNAKSTLQKIATAEGFPTVDAYLAELDTRQKAKLAEKIEEAAGDTDKINDIIENHPKVRETKEIARKLENSAAKLELSKDEFFKELEPKLDEMIESNPTIKPDLLYSVIVGNYVRSDAYKQKLAAEKEQASKKEEKVKETAEKKVLADIHDKERRAAPTGGDTSEGKDTVTPTAFTSKLAGIFGVSASKVAQRSHEMMKRR